MWVSTLYIIQWGAFIGTHLTRGRSLSRFPVVTKCVTVVELLKKKMKNPFFRPYTYSNYPNNELANLQYFSLLFFLNNYRKVSASNRQTKIVELLSFGRVWNPNGLTPQYPQFLEISSQGLWKFSGGKKSELLYF